MAKIEELLHRRTDLSTFLVHLTRSGYDGTPGLENLKSMISSSTIEARTPFGPAKEHDQHLYWHASQKAVCFTETPLEHVWMMLEAIENRDVHFEPYGVAITKTTARKKGFNPVWYSDISRWGEDWPAKAVNQLVADAVERAKGEDGTVSIESLSAEPIFQLTPYFEQMGPLQGGGRKEFWWEREWRLAGDFNMSLPNRIVAILAPEPDHAHLKAFFDHEGLSAWVARPILDPRGGLERMIAGLANVYERHIGPFPAFGFDF